MVSNRVGLTEWPKMVIRNAALIRPRASHDVEVCVPVVALYLAHFLPQNLDLLVVLLKVTVEVVIESLPSNLVQRIHFNVLERLVGLLGDHQLSIKLYRLRM